MSVTWTGYLTARRFEPMIKSSIAQLLEMNVNPVGFFQDVLNGEDVHKALKFNEAPMPMQQPVNPKQMITPQQMLASINLMMQQNQKAGIQPDNNLNAAQKALNTLASAQASKPQQAQAQQPANPNAPKPPVPNTPVKPVAPVAPTAPVAQTTQPLTNQPIR